VPGSSSSWGIFLSYRREDVTPYARLLQYLLGERIPDARVFMDLDSIEAGLDFAEVIREAVESCAVLVALIGQQWATLADEEGRRRLDDPDDFVRFEVKTALERDVRVVPVLVDGAKPLRREQLPVELHKLARLNAFELSSGRYQYDADRLVDLIQRVMSAAPGTVRQSPPVSDSAARTVPRAHRVRPDGNVLAEAAKDGPEPVRGARAARLIADAERTAQSITDEYSKASALTSVARVLAAADPDRAARLVADAERTAQSITDEYSKALALTSVAKALAATDPDRAERIGRSITDKFSNVSALTSVARVVAAADPDRAARLVADAERIARSITDKLSNVLALTSVARVLAAADPDRAARLVADADRTAQAITDKYRNILALCDVAETLAATHPDRAARLIADAERTAQSITDKGRKASALGEVAKALAAADPDRAERIARSISDEFSKAWALVQIANV
jgi:hypothetical protein